MTTQASDTLITAELSAAEHLQIRSAAVTLQRRWQGQLEDVRPIRDEIERRVRGLLVELGVEARS
jgi:hypothetical protein